MRHYLLACGFLLVVLAGNVGAWWVKGHGSIAEAAAARLPEGVPAFFRAGGKQLGHLSGDPDRWKNPQAKHLRAAESPDHFIDLENLGGHELPADRYQAAALIARLEHRPERTGMLPYALMEHYDRLSCAFYDLRADPTNEAVRMKCLVYAGVLAHYAGDAAMPLHTTRNYDGRPGPDGTLLQRGIHARIDAFPEKNGLTPEEIGRGLEARPVEDMWAYVLKTIHASHAHVNRCYELDAAGAFDKPTAESRAFILERCQAAAQFTLDLWYNAWVRSATLPPPY
jgi:hypothetical protein